MNFWRWFWLSLILIGAVSGAAHFQNLPPTVRREAGLLALSVFVAGVGAGSFLWDLWLTDRWKW